MFKSATVAVSTVAPKLRHLSTGKLTTTTPDVNWTVFATASPKLAARRLSDDRMLQALVDAGSDRLQAVLAFVARHPRELSWSVFLHREPQLGALAQTGENHIRIVRRLIELEALVATDVMNFALAANISPDRCDIVALLDAAAAIEAGNQRTAIALFDESRALTKELHMRALMEMMAFEYDLDDVIRPIVRHEPSAAERQAFHAELSRRDAVVIGGEEFLAVTN